jgi:hypothetical protein
VEWLVGELVGSSIDLLKYFFYNFYLLFIFCGFYELDRPIAGERESARAARHRKVSVSVNVARRERERERERARARERERARGGGGLLVFIYLLNVNCINNNLLYK